MDWAGVSPTMNSRFLNRGLAENPAVQGRIPVQEEVGQTRSLFPPENPAHGGVAQVVSTMSTRFPDWARAAARLAVTKVLPSWGAELVIMKNFLDLTQGGEEQIGLDGPKGSATWE